MNNTLLQGQSNGNIYNEIAQVQSIYSHYIQLRTQLKMLDDRFRLSNEEFDRYPTTQNIYAMENIWYQKRSVMLEICHVVSNIVINLTEATKIILTSLHSSIEFNNKLSILLNDNAIASIYSLIDQNQYQLDIKEMYRQSCLMQNISSLLNNIEIKTQMMRLSLPNFDNLKRFIRGY